MRLAVKRNSGGPTVGALYTALGEIAPWSGAADWDNVGLLVGSPDWPARRILTALDLTDAVAREALRKKIDALVLYHPPIFKPIRGLTPDTPGPTSLLPELATARVALLATHTAFDAATGGANDLLLDLLKPVRRYPLMPEEGESDEYKLAVFAPRADVERLRRGLSEAGAGVIGHYLQCSFESEGRGTFFGDETANPAVGRKRTLETVAEVKLEMVAPRRRLGAIVRALYENHSYEEPAFDVYPLHRIGGRGRSGMGRIGEFQRRTTGHELVKRLAEGVDLSLATVVGALDRGFQSVAVAVGAFGAEHFHSPDCLAITGELKHHEALLLIRRGVSALCLGHYASERLVLPGLRERLRKTLKTVKIAIANADRSPFRPLRF